MRIPSLLLLLCAATVPARGVPAFVAEAGASHFEFRGGSLDGSIGALAVDEPARVAPYLAFAREFSDRFGLRLSYHFLDNVRTTAVFGGPPGVPPSPLPVVVWGHYLDDVHLLTLSPEFKWRLAPKMSFSFAPQLNWIASRGLVRYSSDSAFILLVGPQRRNDDGFTPGGATRLTWSLGPRAALTLGYQYSDLEPSFDREAHVFSGGFAWRF